MKRIALLLVCLLGALSLTACVTPTAKSLVITPPTTVTYVAGAQDKINLTGAQVGIKYSDGKVKNKVALSNAAVAIADYSLDIAGTVVITVTYKGLSGTFNVTVIPAQNGDRIEIQTVPDKVKYGPSARPQNVELRGGMLKVYFKDGTDALVPLSNPAVKVREINFTTLKITVVYLGMTAEYSFTQNNDEKGFLTLVNSPDRTKYRNNATAADIDLTGGTFNLTLEGVDKGDISMTDANIRSMAFSADKKYVTYQYDISSYSGYTGMLKGSFDITTVSTWAESIEVKTAPTKREYHATATAANIELAGGVVTVTDNLGAKTDMPLPNPNNISAEIVLSPDDEYIGVVTLTYRDEIATAARIVDSYNVTITADTHTPQTILNYCAAQMPEVSTLRLDRIISITERQKTLATRGFDLYTGDDITDKAANTAQRDKIVPFAFYTDYFEVLAGWDGFNDKLDDYLAGDITETQFLNYCNTFDGELDTFFAKYSDDNVKDVLLYVTGDEDAEEITVSDKITEMRLERDNRLTPYLDDAIGKAEAIAAALTALPTPATIKDAYDMFMAERDTAETTDKDRNRMVAAICKVLTSVYPNAVDILYDHYFDPGIPIRDEDTHTINQQEIYNLIMADVFPEIIIDLIPVLQRMMRYYAFGNYIMLLTEYDEFEALSTALKPANYAFSAMPKVYESISKTAYYNKKWQDPEESGIAIGIYSLATMIEVSEALYNEVLFGNYGSILSDTDFMNFVETYGAILSKWMPTADDWHENPFPQNNAEFENDFKTVAALYEPLSNGQKSFMLNYLDVSGYSYDGISYYIQMAEAYLMPHMTVQEHDLFIATMSAFVPMASMLESGLEGKAISMYLDRMETLYTLYTDGDTLNEEFETYFGYMLEACLDNYSTLSMIDSLMYDVIDVLVLANEAWENYESDQSANTGFVFVMIYEQLESAINTWLELGDEEESYMDGIIFGSDLSILEQITILRQGYDSTYGPFEGDEYFERIFNMFRLMAEYDNYIYSDSFKSAMGEIIATFEDMNRAERISYLNVTRSVLVQLYQAYLIDNNMTEAELKMIPSLIKAYHNYLIMEEIGSSDPGYAAAEAELITAMTEAIAMRSEMAAVSKSFRDLLQPLYENMSLAAGLEPYPA